MVEVDSADLVRIILQYLRENGLKKSFEALSNETGVLLDALDDKSSLILSISGGEWERVFHVLNDLLVPQ